MRLVMSDPSGYMVHRCVELAIRTWLRSCTYAQSEEDGLYHLSIETCDDWDDEAPGDVRDWIAKYEAAPNGFRRTATVKSEKPIKEGERDRDGGNSRGVDNEGSGALRAPVLDC